jgi:hypothetical protein
MVNLVRNKRPYSGAPGSEKCLVARIEKKRFSLISCDAQLPNHRTPSDKKKLENDSGKPPYRS